LASIYPATVAGLRQLVADDVAMLPASNGQRLKRREADWEKGIGVTCIPSGGGKWCYPDAGMMIQTIQWHIFKLDDCVFDDTEWSATFPMDPKAAEDVGSPSGTWIKLDQNIPQIVTPLTLQAIAFNYAIKAYAVSNWMRAGGPPQSHPREDQYDDLTLDYTPNMDAIPGVLSISFAITDYTHGAAHDGGQVFDYNWYITKGRHVIPADIFKPNVDWQLAVATAGVAALASEPQYRDSPRTPQNMEQFLSDPTTWAILRTGLRIDTDFYEVCPYSCGAPPATIPWTALRAYLLPQGLSGF